MPENDDRPYIVGIGGTTRPASSSERVLRVSLEAAEKAGARTHLIPATELIFPMYDPHVPGRAENAEHFIEQIRVCDGLLIATPGYHGSFSGLIKNALDYIEDLREDERPYLTDRAVGCIVTAAGWQATATTLIDMRSVVHALRGWATPLGVCVNSALPIFDKEGHLVDGGCSSQLTIVAEQVVQFANWQRRG